MICNGRFRQQYYEYYHYYNDLHKNYLDIDECELGFYTDECDENAVCINNEGSFTCQCQLPYFGDGRTCESKQTTLNLY